MFRKTITLWAVGLAAAVLSLGQSSLQIEGMKVRASIPVADGGERVIFKEIVPCRLVDTRQESKFDSPYGAPSFQTVETRSYGLPGPLATDSSNPCALDNRRRNDVDARAFPADVVGLALRFSVINRTDESPTAGIIIIGRPDPLTGEGGMGLWFGWAGPDSPVSHETLVKLSDGQFPVTLIPDATGLANRADVQIDVLGFLTSDPLADGSGPAGPQGPRGPQGPKGDQGSAGPQGQKGDLGPAGPQGERGDRGPAGPQGQSGERGPAGPSGPQGARGDIGPIGPIGPQGPKGEQGVPGTCDCPISVGSANCGSSPAGPSPESFGVDSPEWSVCRVTILDASIKARSTIMATYNTRTSDDQIPLRVFEVRDGSFKIEAQSGTTFHWLAYTPKE